ncbi:Protein of unknown function [Gryllus bimaculatus]|nr:Protein of unknown function [Gryllus bimaculatus]
MEDAGDGADEDGDGGDDDDDDNAQGSGRTGVRETDCGGWKRKVWDKWWDRRRRRRTLPRHVEGIVGAGWGQEGFRVKACGRKISRCGYYEKTEVLRWFYEDNMRHRVGTENKTQLSAKKLFSSLPTTRHTRPTIPHMGTEWVTKIKYSEVKRSFIYHTQNPHYDTTSSSYIRSYISLTSQVDQVRESAKKRRRSGASGGAWPPEARDAERDPRRAAGSSFDAADARRTSASLRSRRRAGARGRGRDLNPHPPDRNQTAPRAAGRGRRGDGRGRRGRGLARPQRPVTCPTCPRRPQMDGTWLLLGARTGFHVGRCGAANTICSQ